MAQLRMGLPRLWLWTAIIIVAITTYRGLCIPAGRGDCRIRCGPTGSRPGNFNEDDLIDRVSVRGGYRGSGRGSLRDNDNENYVPVITDRHGVPSPGSPAMRYTVPDRTEAFDLLPWFNDVYQMHRRNEHPVALQTHRFVTVISHLGLPVWIELLWIWTSYPREIHVAIFVPTPDNISMIYRERMRRHLNRMTIRTSLYSMRMQSGSGLVAVPRIVRPQPLSTIARDHQRLLPMELGVRAPFSTWHYETEPDGPDEHLRIGHLGDDYLHHLADGHGPLHNYFSDSDHDSDHEGHHQHDLPNGPRYRIETFHRRYLFTDILARGSSVIMLQSDFIIEDEPIAGSSGPSQA